MNFNIRILLNHYMHTPMSHYYIRCSTKDKIKSKKSYEDVKSLNPECIYGEDFKALRKNIRFEYNKTQDPKLEMTGALRKRLSLVEKKMEELMKSFESLERVYFHFNNKMPHPMIIACVGVRTGSISGIEQGRVIISGVKTIIEENHLVFGRQCNYYTGIWNIHRSKLGNDFVNIDMTKRDNEKPMFIRGVLKGVNSHKVNI